MTEPMRARLRRRMVPLACVVFAHSLVLLVLLRPGDQTRDAEHTLQVELREPTPAEPALPMPVVKVVRATVRAPMARLKPAAPDASQLSIPAIANRDPATLPPKLFDRDGQVILPREPSPGKADATEKGVALGRELMARGLNCAYAIENHESLGESTARKYLAWIGLYNPYKAQRLAELEQERQERCKRWKE